MLLYCIPLFKVSEKTLEKYINFEIEVKLGNNISIHTSRRRPTGTLPLYGKVLLLPKNELYERTAYQLAQRKEIETFFPKANEKAGKMSEVFSSTAFSVVSENMKMYLMLELEGLLQKQ